jgi:PAS domain S-box-containing protein
VVEREAGRSQPETGSFSELVHRVVSILPIPIAYLDTSLVFRMCGDAAATALGRRPADIVGRHVAEVFGAQDQATVALQEAVESKAPRNHRMRQRIEGAHDRFWDVALVPDVVDGSVSGIVCTGFDITDLITTQEQLAESEALYRSVGELLPYGTWTAKNDGSLTYLSDSFAEMTGLPAEQLLGWGWLDLLPSQEARDDARAEWHRSIKGNRLRDTVHEVRSADGSYRYVMCRGIRLDSDSSEAPRWAGIHIDVTERERSRQFKESLGAVQDMLVTSLETEDLLARVGQTVLGPTVADFAAIVVPAGRDWRVRYTAELENGSAPGALLRPAARLPRDTMPLSVLAFETGEIQIAVDALHDHRVNAERARKDGLRSLAVLPIKRNGESICLLALAYTSVPIIADQPMMEFLSNLLRSLDLALQTATIHEHQKHIAERLQESLLAVPNDLPNVELAHVYHAAAEQTRVGGDFYDAFELRGAIAFVIGDISGSGLEAAALTASVKNTIRAHLIDGQTPGGALTKANVVMQSLTQSHEFATVFIGILDPWNGEIQYACAGHPPPLAVGHGRARALEGGGMLLGAFEGSRYEDYSCTLDPEETVVLYTDGITEARRDGVLFGDERLAACLESVEEKAPYGLLRRVLEEVRSYSDDVLNDDIALLAIRPAPEEAAPESGG